MKLFRNESGFALPLALLVLVTTSAILVTAIKTTSSSGRTANLGKTAVSAEALAEAALANGVSILAKPGQNTNTQALFPSTEATATVYTMENGTGKLWGVYNTDDERLDAVRQGVAAEPDRRRAGHEDSLEDGLGARHRGRRDGARVEPLHPRRREQLLHDRHRHDPGSRGVPWPHVPRQRRQRRREHDRR